MEKIEINSVWAQKERHPGGYFISSSGGDPALESSYLKVRKKEGRIFNDELVRKLPLIDKTDKYFKEWELRLIAAMRLHKYLLDKRRSLKILDIGCGNGWMSNLMTEVFESLVFGIDVNRLELEQASRLFGNKNRLHFAYHNILKEPFPERDFDVILLAATIQYFPDLSNTLSELLNYLSPHGEIHIIDSPVYSSNEVLPARQRTNHYYEKMQVPEMTAFYSHHSYESLSGLNWKIKYDPGLLINKVRRKILDTSDSPFPWIVVYNPS